MLGRSVRPIALPTMPGQNVRQSSGETEKIVHIFFPVEEIDFS
jgi:hypothetical protein